MTIVISLLVDKHIHPIQSEFHVPCTISKKMLSYDDNFCGVKFWDDVVGFTSDTYTVTLGDLVGSYSVVSMKASASLMAFAITSTSEKNTIKVNPVIHQDSGDISDSNFAKIMNEIIWISKVFSPNVISLHTLLCIVLPIISNHKFCYWLGAKRQPLSKSLMIDFVLRFNKHIFFKSPLTQWGRVTYICVGNLTIIGSDNGLSSGRRQAIIWTNNGILLMGPLETNFSDFLIEILTFLFK